MVKIIYLQDKNIDDVDEWSAEYAVKLGLAEILNENGLSESDVKMLNEGIQHAHARKEAGLVKDEKGQILPSITQEAIELARSQLKIEQEKIKIEKAKEKEKKKKDVVGLLRLDNYMGNAEDYYNIQPYFYDKSNIFWLWNSELCKYEYSDDVDMMRILDDVLGFKGQTVSSKIKGNTLEALKRFGRNKQPKPSKKKWIQFKDKAYSIFSGKVHDVTPDYFFTNPIPWEVGETSDTPIMDKLFSDWVGENKELLYEIIAYCCYTDYPIHKIFCFIGNGSNGKSRYIALLCKFLGLSNICSTELDVLLDNKFESFKLYKKLACFMGETNFGVLTKTSMLKKLSGQDVVGYEMKGKQPFDETNYAKIIISSNSLPISDDTTDGFYRRWMIIEFNNQFNEGKDILETIPEIEYNNLARKVTEILPKIIKEGKFIKQGDIRESKEKYILASNPLSTFLKICCEKKPEGFASYGKMHTLYNNYLSRIKKRKVKHKEFKQCLEDEGFWVEKTSIKINGEFKSGFWVEGLIIKPDFDVFDNFDLIPIPTPTRENGYNNLSKTSNQSKIIVHLPCYICKQIAENGNMMDNQERPICETCFETIKLGIT